jgi:hypothetical protein
MVGRCKAPPHHIWVLGSDKNNEYFCRNYYLSTKMIFLL